MTRYANPRDCQRLGGFERTRAQTYLTRYANPRDCQRLGGSSNKLDDSLFDMYSHWVFHKKCIRGLLTATREAKQQCIKMQLNYVKCFKEWLPETSNV